MYLIGFRLVEEANQRIAQSSRVFVIKPGVLNAEYKIMFHVKQLPQFVVVGMKNRWELKNIQCQAWVIGV